MSKSVKLPSDGTERVPRQAQLESFIDINREILKQDCVFSNLPPGYGKSFILRSLQRDSGSADLITSDNSLIGQYVADYPVLNAVMGKDRYENEEDYHEAHKRAKSGVPSIYNPLSYHYARQRGLRTPDLILIDEAHLLIDMLTYLSAHVIPIAKTQVPENAKNEGDLIKWAFARFDRLQKAISLSGPSKELLKEYESIARLKDTLEEGSQNQVFELSKAMVPVNGKRPQKCLILTPVRVPHSLIKAVTSARKVIAVSGTLSKYDAEQLAAGRSMSYIQRPYLTPKENRPVYFNPVDQDLRKDPQTIADKILEIYNANPVPTLVHVTYAMQAELSQLLGNIRPLVNNTTNKLAVKERFLRHGGLWLAAGCAEGVDLPGDACRQVIIPVLMYPDRGDLFVQKRVGLPDGDRWYKIRTIQNTIQRLGRGLRSEDDWCVSHILDPSFARLYPQVKDEFASLNVIWEKM